MLEVSLDLVVRSVCDNEIKPSNYTSQCICIHREYREHIRYYVQPQRMLLRVRSASLGRGAGEDVADAGRAGATARTDKSRGCSVRLCSRRIRRRSRRQCCHPRHFEARHPSVTSRGLTYRSQDLSGSIAGHRLQFSSIADTSDETEPTSRSGRHDSE